MAELAVSTKQILTVLQRLIEGEEALVPPTMDIREAVEIKEVSDQPALLIRERAHLDQLNELIPAALAEVHGHVKAAGVAVAGPPVVLTPPWTTREWSTWRWAGRSRTALGAPVASRTQRCRPGTMLVYEHRGPYRELGRAHHALWELVEREGLTVDGSPREVYVTDPEEVPDPALVRDEARIAELSAGTGAPREAYP
jgi:effector-binding domain-containing protein